MSLVVTRLTLGVVATNCYVLADTATSQAVVIDPVDDAPRILAAAQDNGCAVKLILATHTHFDHILASQELKALTGAPFAIHPDGLELLRTLPQWGVLMFETPFPEAAEPDRWLSTETETIEVGSIRLETLYTPGHAPGHISFFMPDQSVVFTGDSLFAGSIGRTDLPGGSFETLIESITTRLLILDDNIAVLPGHGEASTIGREKRTNPYLVNPERR